MKVLIVFDDMIADMLNIKKLNTIVIKLFIRDRKLNISHVFITQYFSCTKNYQPEFYTLFHYENSKQRRASKN